MSGVNRFRRPGQRTRYRDMVSSFVPRNYVASDVPEMYVPENIPQFDRLTATGQNKFDSALQQSGAIDQLNIDAADTAHMYGSTVNLPDSEIAAERSAAYKKQAQEAKTRILEEGDMSAIQDLDRVASAFSNDRELQIVGKRKQALDELQKQRVELEDSGQPHRAYKIEREIKRMYDDPYYIPNTGVGVTDDVDMFSEINKVAQYMKANQGGWAKFAYDGNGGRFVQKGTNKGISFNEAQSIFGGFMQENPKLMGDIRAQAAYEVDRLSMYSPRELEVMSNEDPSIKLNEDGTLDRQATTRNKQMQTFGTILSSASERSAFQETSTDITNVDANYTEDKTQKRLDVSGGMAHSYRKPAVQVNDFIKEDSSGRAQVDVDGLREYATANPHKRKKLQQQVEFAVQNADFDSAYNEYIKEVKEHNSRAERYESGSDPSFFQPLLHPAIQPFSKQEFKDFVLGQASGGLIGNENSEDIAGTWIGRNMLFNDQGDALVTAYKNSGLQQQLANKIASEVGNAVEEQTVKIPNLKDKEKSIFNTWLQSKNTSTFGGQNVNYKKAEYFDPMTGDPIEDEDIIRQAYEKSLSGRENHEFDEHGQTTYVTVGTGDETRTIAVRADLEDTEEARINYFKELGDLQHRLAPTNSDAAKKIAGIRAQLKLDQLLNTGQVEWEDVRKLERPTNGDVIYINDPENPKHLRYNENTGMYETVRVKTGDDPTDIKSVEMLEDPQVYSPTTAKFYATDVLR